MASLPVALNMDFPLRVSADCIIFSYIVNEFLVYFVARTSTITIRNAQTGLNAMASQSKAALELKHLRERAGYSVRQLATVLRAAGSAYGRSPSTYAYYENQFRRPYLPGDLVESLVPLLAGRGVPPIAERQVLVLGGPQFNSLWVASGVIAELGEDRRAAEIDGDLLARILERITLLAVEKESEFSDRQHALLAVRLYRQIVQLPYARQAAALEREIEDILEIGRIFVKPPA